MSELTHFNQAGEAHMVDIADKTMWSVCHYSRVSDSMR